MSACHGLFKKVYRTFVAPFCDLCSFCGHVRTSRCIEEGRQTAVPQEQDLNQDRTRHQKRRKKRAAEQLGWAVHQWELWEAVVKYNYIE